MCNYEEQAGGDSQPEKDPRYPEDWIGTCDHCEHNRELSLQLRQALKKKLPVGVRCSVLATVGLDGLLTYTENKQELVICEKKDIPKECPYMVVE